MGEGVRDGVERAAGGHAVSAAFDALYNWNYEPEIDALRTLYANALERQWIALRDLPWDDGIDREAFTADFRMGGIPISETDFWRGLPLDVRWDVARASTAFLLSNFLHGEQGALMVAAQLVNAVPHMDGKFYAATQTLDEARHVEAFAAYIRKLDAIVPITPGLQALLDAVIAAPDWTFKAVGMQIVVEGLALYMFRDMRSQTREPLLAKLLTYVSRDEARHTGYGIKYLTHVVPQLGEKQRDELQDFAFETTRMLMASRAGNDLRDQVMAAWTRGGVDPSEALARIARERDVIAENLARTGGRHGPVSGFVIPTLRAIGLYSERVHERFRQMWAQSQGEAAAAVYAASNVPLPEDLEAWVEEVPGR